MSRQREIRQQRYTEEAKQQRLDTAGRGDTTRVRLVQEARDKPEDQCTAGSSSRSTHGH